MKQPRIIIPMPNHACMAVIHARGPSTKISTNRDKVLISRSKTFSTRVGCADPKSGMWLIARPSQLGTVAPTILLNEIEDRSLSVVLKSRVHTG